MPDNENIRLEINKTYVCKDKTGDEFKCKILGPWDGDSVKVYFPGSGEKGLLNTNHLIWAKETEE